MAKRKRKMTLFDVMHQGHSVGLQVRTRVPTYQPTPELPVMKKLSKLFGRAPKADPNRPTSAADELAALRRELAGKTADPEPVVEESAPEPEPTFTRSTPIADAFASRREEPVAPREAAVPRKRLGEVFKEQWAVLSPKLASLLHRAKAIGGQGGEYASRGIAIAREYSSRYAVTAASAMGVIILLCGSFYAGKLLFNRPANNNLGAGSSIASDIRPEVLDVNNTARANEPIANIDTGQPETQLQRQADPQKPTTPAVFGGRRLDVNYVIIQSYPTQAEALATVDLLAKYNVKSTVEVNLPRYSSAGSTLYSVVGVEPYQKLSGNDAYEAYKAKIIKISETEKGRTLAKSLTPSPYRWTAATPQ